MEWMQWLGAGYVILINIITYSVYYADKQRAKKRSYRISEHTLLLLAAVGGSLGAWLAMKQFRHKTLHLKFTLGVPLIILLQVLLLGFCYYYRK